MNDASLPTATVLSIRDQCLCLATQRAARRLARRFDRLFAPLGLTNGQFSLMVALSGPWQPRMGELADFLAMDSTTMTAAIKPLEKSGLVAVMSDDADRRIRRPQLTAEGRVSVRQAVRLWTEEHSRVAEEAQTADPATLARMIDALG